MTNWRTKGKNNDAGIKAGIRFYKIFAGLLWLCFGGRRSFFPTHWHCLSVPGLRSSVIFTFLSLIIITSTFAQTHIRFEKSLNQNWRTAVNDTSQTVYDGFERVNFDDSGWKQVDIPHNWDEYHGFRQMKHGNRHGYAWYRKSFKLELKDQKKENRYFLIFEGVGSYGSVWLNGKKAGQHAGGRTTFTLDVTDVINPKGENVLAVRADHPAFIADLPWVCGGCSAEWGFSEGSQPMGIFRPVRLIVTNPVRIEPFGVHIWNDDKISAKAALLNINTEVKNYGSKNRNLQVINRLLDPDGREVLEISRNVSLSPGEMTTVSQVTPEISNPRLWSTEDPALYKIVTEIREKGTIVDELVTDYGIRWISWPIGRDWGGNQFFLNGKPVFINGICEYEHNIGQSHAFTGEQVLARAKQMKAAGFNAFRDAHQPHNFQYHKFWDEQGMLFWTQMSAHIWYDTPEFRENFKRLLRQWVKERRNSPSVVLWGLQNESTIPEDFARECTEIIREMDPTASGQRKVTTCNGGVGTDWDVPQNWSGTYGGDPDKYGEELSRQVLNGEYGAWRSIDWHTEGDFVQNGPWSEDRMTLLMETKVRLAESVKDQCSGQFHWLFNSHENPGRVQNGEGYRDIDKVGPVNYKGLVTPWGEPLDVYYMFRANYAPKETEPMVYIVSHTWPDRWTTPGLKDSIRVFSNCDEVELFNDVKSVSLGKLKNPGIGSHFIWDRADIQYNVLYAVGYIDGKPVAEDCIVLHHLPESPNFNELKKDAQPVTAPQNGLHYLYRVNCGGPDYRDQNGNLWMADVQKTQDDAWGSLSWTDEFPGMPPFFASQRRIHDPVKGTNDWPLIQTFRFGTDKLKFNFPVPDGEYYVELFFVEPWYGTGGGIDAEGWRIFDVAVNENTVIENLDIWNEAGHDRVLKKTVRAQITGGQLEIHFPRVTAGQALVSAIAIATENPGLQPAQVSPSLIGAVRGEQWQTKKWLDTGDRQFVDSDARFSALPTYLFTAEWISGPSSGKPGVSFNVANNCEVFIMVNETAEKPLWFEDYEEKEGRAQNNAGQVFKMYSKKFLKGATVNLGEETKGLVFSVAVLPETEMGDEGEEIRPMIRYEAEDAVASGSGLNKAEFRKEVYVAMPATEESALEWEINPGLAGVYLVRFRYMNMSDQPVPVRLEILADDGRVMRNDMIEFPPAPEKWRSVNTTTGSYINAGKYKVRLSVPKGEGLRIDAFEFQ